MAKKKKTIAERRVAVLKDALKQLAVKNLLACPGTFLSGRDADNLLGVRYDDYLGEDEAKEQVQSFLTEKFKKKNLKCQVCARGALLLSTIHKENTFTKEDVSNMSGGSYSKSSVEDQRLAKLFLPKTIPMMETAFEACTSYGYSLSQKDQEKAIKFGEKYTDPDKRLIAIFKNAIKNKGTFKP